MWTGATARDCAMIFQEAFLNTRLSTRLIVFIVVLQATMLSFVVAYNSWSLTSSHAAMFEAAVRAESHSLSLALADATEKHDRTSLHQLLNQFANDNDVAYMEVVGRDGATFANTGSSPVPWQVDESYQSALSDSVYDVEYPIQVDGQKLGTLRIGYSVKNISTPYQMVWFQNTTVVVVLTVLSITAFFGFFFTGNLRKLEAVAKTFTHEQRDGPANTEKQSAASGLTGTFNHLVQGLSEAREALSKEHNTLERETRFMQALLDGIDAVVMEARLPGYQFTFVSREAQNLLGYAVSDWLKPDFWKRHVVSDDLAWLGEVIEGHTAKKESFTVDFRMSHRHGHTVWVRAINSVELDEDGQPILRGLFLDITEQKTAEDRIVYLAEHDALTGLINRRRFQKELDRAIAFAHRYQQQGALLFVDLDQFKYVNDTYGHQYGDEYLLDVSRRLSQVLRRTDVLGRLGGDEFGVVIPKCSFEEAHTVGMALLGALAQENLEQGGKVVPVSASIGIALFPTQSAVPSDLLAKADAAMYTAKRKGRGQVHVYSEDDTELWNMQAKIHWEEQIRWALAEDRFELYFQPVVELNAGLITHYEVLLRMRGEDGEMIAPAAFIETAERFGLIRDIDRWVVDHAIRMQATSIKEHKPVSLAINLSGRHFGNIDMLEFIQSAIQTYGADPNSLMFEVTETEAVENLSKAREFIDALRRIGCKFALDDFGIGFSSFHYLRNLPVDYIKIDGSFVRSLHVDADDRLFVTAIVDLAKGLNIPCIAEFVENAHIVDILIELGVDLGQGYHLAKPHPEFIDGQLIRL